MFCNRNRDRLKVLREGSHHPNPSPISPCRNM
ncbi:hypothetical protein [Ethanoligenens sp.]